MINAIVLLAAAAIAGYLAFSPRLARSSRWKATVTPLASIMGSGFLVSAPLLATTVGLYALPAMACLLLLAYTIGGAIRFNIRYFEPIEHAGHGPTQTLAFLSRVVLSGAYFISVSYYLQLLAAFLGTGLGIESEMFEELTTTALLVLIGGIGMWRGLDMLEGLEKYTVALNLGMIGALLLALAIYNAGLAVSGQWQLPTLASGADGHDLRVLLGLLIVVQGFETSRYLGDEHCAEERIATMRLAQWISAAVYLVFIGLATVLFTGDTGADVTAIIHLMGPVAAVLPALIAIAAISSQFSAAAADNEAAGGLVEDITHGRLPIRYAYAFVLLATLAITWSSNVNQIIAYASRAFALFYALQCLVALQVAWGERGLAHRRWRVVGYGLLGGACLLVFALGIPAE
ncbi:hypothetical protein E4634_04765 [Mangrovimicrobium sediminis]|uniref:Amino acid permease n=1 Tax=Mangrovimicrobium sediminis TaxID=2562682 RepID=A0A4Z0M7D6_9GAMM|nr:hypothetical protein [Haliea sp. SAOS-164]TGD75307.1 hypothetical protein E4634_04765 [Haliea sp. SAOS-164]